MTFGQLFRAIILTASLFAALWTFCSCAVSQQLTIRTDGSGDTSIIVQISPEIASYLREIATLTGAKLPETGLIDLSPINKSLEARPGLTIVRVEAPVEHQVELEFSFEDVEAIFRSASLLWEAGVVTFEEIEGKASLRLYLDIDNYRQLSTLFPVLDDPVIRAIGPEENTDISAKDYLSMMGFVLGPGGPPAISESLIIIKVTVDGELISQSGGRMEGETLIYEIPLLDFLLLHEPIDLRVVFQ